MSIFVKICGLRNAGDVKAAVAAGADAVGFVFAESVRRVTPADALKASRYLPGRVRRVAVMRTLSSPSTFPLQSSPLAPWGPVKAT